MKFKLAAWQVLVAVALVTLTVAILWRKKESAQTPPSVKTTPTFKEISKGDYGVPQADQILLTDGTVVEGLGYMSSVVGILERPGKSPLILIRTLSCWDCTPEYLLRMFDADSQEFIDMPHPLRRTIGSPESDKELVDRLVRGVYGYCIDRKPSVLIVSQSRQIDSDGEELKVPDQWDMETHRLTIREDGSVSHEKAQDGGFSELNSLVSDTCMEISPEEISEDI